MLGTQIVKRELRYPGSCVGQNPVSGSSGSDSDSGNSIFITQHPVKPRRRGRSGSTSAAGTTGKARDKKREKRVKLPTFGFDHFKDGKPTRVELKKNQNIHYHNALIGGFFSSVRELQACPTGDLLSSLPTVDKEGDFIAPISEDEIVSEEDVIVRKKDFVVFSKTKRPQPWYTPPKVNEKRSDASNTSHDREGRASRSGSSHGKPSGNRRRDNNWTRVQAEASQVTQKRLFPQEEMLDIRDSNSDATLCELPEEDQQNGGGASPAEAQLQADEQEELEAQNDDSQSRKTECEHLNVPSDHTVQVGELCSEITTGSEVKDESIKKKKKKKKKKKHQSESEENYIDGSFLNDAFNLPENQELTVTKKSLDGCTGNTADGVKESQQVTKKNKKRNKEKKRNRQQSPNPFSDTEPQCDDSVSVLKAELNKQTTSCADAGTSERESAEIIKHDKVRKKKKKRKLEPTIADEKPSETLQMDEAKRRKEEQSPGTFASALSCDADCEQIVKDGVVKKKKKKKKKKKRETEGVSPARGQQIQSGEVSCCPLTQEKRSLTPDGHNASPATHTNNPSKKRRKRKRDILQTAGQNLTDETEAAEMKTTEVAAVFSESPAVNGKSSHSISHRKKKHTLYNPSEDFFTGC